MDRTKTLSVKYQNQKVGTLALYQKRFVVFEYTKEWILNGFSISPYSLPLEKKVFIPKWDPFEGLFGVFSDSLPDGWGRLLVDRMLLANQILPQELSQLERLAIVGGAGMGALTYEPEQKFQIGMTEFTDLDRLACECEKILKNKESENLDELFLLGGSSGGARPKIMKKINEEDWIIKFESSHDLADAGIMEYEYSLCAKECGIDMEETQLFGSVLNKGYFGTRRFDRQKIMGEIPHRLHMVSVSAMLETSHRIPNLDYMILFRLVLDLTKDYSEVIRLYRLMCFNVFAHNRDDHSKNFSFLYYEDSKSWKLSPAYDLTYSNSLGGEHATCINGNGKNPGMKELVEVGKNFGIREGEARNIATEIYEIVTMRLGNYIGRR
ncbi:MAG: type II toxin-antitoxin system HipA family toxin [Vallitaleaceae bacterium]|nr:type II toxin-antitoxin system HipA family toxin [Vallitaleaceae bacterium]